MDRLIAPNTVTEAQADTAPATGTGAWATDGNPAANVPATQWPAYQYNAFQEELAAIIEAAGITLDRTKNNQVLEAIQALMQGSATQVGTDTGAANVCVVAFSPALTAPIPWVPFWFKVKATNTGASTLNATGTAEPLVGGAHLALQGHELVASGNALVYWNPTLASGAGSYVLMFCSGGALQTAPAVAAGQAVQLGQMGGQYIGSLQVLSSVSLTAAMATFTVGGRSVQATTARFRGQVAGGGGGGALPTGAGQASAGGGGNAGNPFEFVVSGIAFPVSITVGAPGTGSLGVAGTFGVTGGDLVAGSYATIKGGLGGPAGGLVGAFPAFNGLSGQGSNPASTFAAGVKVLNDGIGQVGNISTLLSASAVSPGQGGAGPYGSVALGSGGTSGYGVGGVAALNGVSSGSGKQGGTAQPALLMIDFYS